MGHILKMQPVFKEVIWGGHQLREEFGYEIPSELTGECWAISAHPHGDCTIANGEFQGKTLSQLYSEHRELFGNLQNEQFPLMVKLIDANNDLSVQVHPDDAYALKHENTTGKCECWYVLDAKKGTKMIMGHHAQTKEELIQAIENDDYEHLLNIFEINKGDFFFIPAGTLHAICSGSLIYEAQQSCDITYRVYDYHRKDAQGNERELHVQQSIDVTKVPADNTANQLFVNSHLDHGSKTSYLESDIFSVDCYRMTGKNTIENNQPFLMISIIEGEGTLENKNVKKGDHFVICSDQKEITFDGFMTVMVAYL